MDILARTLLPRDDTPSNGSCPWQPPFDENAAQPIFGNTTFYHFNLYFSGVCAVLASVTIFTLIFLHGTHFSRPSEQLKIIKVAMLIPSYSLISWISILAPESYYSLNPWLEVVQSVSLSAFFLLLCEFVSPDEGQRAMFFAGLDKVVSQRDRKGKVPKANTPEQKIMWYRRQWILIFQYPPVAIFCAILTDVTESLGKFCGNSMNPKYANIWVEIFQNVSVTFAVASILVMYQTLAKHLAHHQPLAKLAAFKLVVFLGFVQQIIFLILGSTSALAPTSTLTYADMKVGIPTLLTCIEMVPIAFFFHYAYSYRAYVIDGPKMPVPSAESKVSPRPPVSSYQGGFLGWRAYVGALNPMIVWDGLIFAFKMASEYRKMKADMASGSSLEPLRKGGASPYGHRAAVGNDGFEGRYEPYNEQHAPLQPNMQQSSQMPLQQETRYGVYPGADQNDYHVAERYDTYRPAPSYGDNAYLAPSGSPPRDAQMYGGAPSPPTASHSRSPSRTGELERPGNGFY